MNDRSVKPRQAIPAAEKGKPQSGQYPRTSNVDDEFHEFFNKGDIGEYEGGVAYSQPPSRLLPEVDEQILIADPARQRARRAFFGRVVAIIVAACVVLLVTATRFKPHDAKRDSENDPRHASVQFAEAEEVKLSPPPKEQPRVVPLVSPASAVPSTLPQVAAVAAPPPPEPSQPQEVAVPSDAQPVHNSPAGSARILELAKAVTPGPQTNSPATTLAAKVSSGSGAVARHVQKSKATAAREAPSPAMGISKPVKESVGAFPVD